MTKQDVISILEAGGQIVDIGQLDSAAKAHLQRETRAGRVRQDVSYNFPIPKAVYRAVMPR